MSLFILSALLLAQAPQIGGDSGVGQEVVVIGRKLKKWRFRYEVRGNKSFCKTKKSTGDVDVDTIDCSAFSQCLTPLQSRIDVSDSEAVPVRERKAMKVAIKADLSACVTQRRYQLIADLAERRYQARQGQSN